MKIRATGVKFAIIYTFTTTYANSLTIFSLTQLTGRQAELCFQYQISVKIFLILKNINFYGKVISGREFNSRNSEVPMSVK